MWWTRLFSTPLLGDEHGVRLRVHIMQRWLAVLGQLTTVLVVELSLQVDLPLPETILTILGSVALNLWLALQYPRNHILTDREATLFFALDIMQLAVLLYLTGGLANPFAILVLAPLALGATVLRARSVLVLGIMGATLVTGLRLFYTEMFIPGLLLSDMYLDGIWAGLILSIFFIPGFIWRVSHERRRMSRALEATEKVLESETRLSALDGLAAAAAHQLGTPLGTITLIARELSQKPDLDAETRADIELLVQQSHRCRQILASLTDEATQSDVLISHLDLREMLQEACQEADTEGKDFIIDVTGEGSAPRMLRRPEIIYGLGNLIENAADFAETQVKIAARYDSKSITIRIIDDGPGFDPDIIERLGEPYTSQRASSGKSGMGLGYFIAKTLLERSGARLTITNQKAPDHDRARKFLGAEVHLRWPRAALEPIE
jgi:two-component system sensor histidine kinase RegB